VLFLRNKDQEYNIRLPVWQPASTGKESHMSELRSCAAAKRFGDLVVTTLHSSGPAYLYTFKSQTSTRSTCFV